MKNIAIINVVGRIISLILIFVFVKGPEDLYLYCFFYAFNILFANIIGFIIVSRKYDVVLQRTSLQSVVREIEDGWSLFLSAVMTRVFSGIGVTVLGFVAASEVIGAYSAINKIPFVLTLAFSAFSQALYPKACKDFKDSFQRGISGVKRFALPVVAMFGIGGCVLVLFHAPIVVLAFGAEYEPYSWLLIPFVLWVMAGIVNNFLGIQILVASGHQKEYSNAFLVSVSAAIVLNIALGKLFGASGVAVAAFMSEAIMTGLLFCQIKKVTKKKSIS